MNKIYRTIWNVARQCVIVAGELARGHQGKKRSDVGSSAELMLSIPNESKRFAQTILTCAILAAFAPVTLAAVDYSVESEIFTGTPIRIVGGKFVGDESFLDYPAQEQLKNNFFNNEKGYAIYANDGVTGYEASVSGSGHSYTFEIASNSKVYARGSSESASSSPQGGLEVLPQMLNKGYLRADAGEYGLFGVYIHRSLTNENELLVVGGSKISDGYGLKVVYGLSNAENAKATFRDANAAFVGNGFTNDGTVITEAYDKYNVLSVEGNFQNKGTVIAKAPVKFANVISVGKRFTNNGTVIVEGGDIRLKTGSFINDGTLRLENEGRIVAPTFESRGDVFLGDGTITVDTFNSNGQDKIDIQGGLLSVKKNGWNSGDIKLESGRISCNGTFTNGGTITVYDGSIRGVENRAKIILANHNPDYAYSNPLEIRQLQPSARVEAPLATFINYRDWHNSTTNRYEFPDTASCKAYHDDNGTIRSDSVSLSAFATGTEFSPRFGEDSLFKNANLQAGVWVVSDTDYSLEAQQQIIEGYKNAYRERYGKDSDLKIEFKGTGTKDLTCRENVFNVENLNTFVKSGYKDYTLPYRFDSDKSEIVIGGTGADIEEGFGVNQIRDTKKITVQDHRKLVLVGDGLDARMQNLVSGLVVLDDSTLQFGYRSLTALSRGGIISKLVMNNDSLLNVEGALRINEQPLVEYHVKDLSGSGAINVVSGNLLIEKLHDANIHRIDLLENQLVGVSKENLTQLTLKGDDSAVIGDIRNSEYGIVTLEGIKSVGSIDNAGTFNIETALEFAGGSLRTPLITSFGDKAKLTLKTPTLKGGDVEGAVALKNDSGSTVEIKDANLWSGARAAAVENNAGMKITNAAVYGREGQAAIVNRENGNLTIDNFQWQSSEPSSVALLNKGTAEVFPSTDYGLTPSNLNTESSTFCRKTKRPQSTD